MEPLKILLVDDDVDFGKRMSRSGLQTSEVKDIN